MLIPDRAPRTPGIARDLTRAHGRATNLERRFVRPRTLLLVIDGVGSEITTGIKGEATVHFDCKIIGWRLLADQEGDIVIDLWKSDYDSYPPDVGDTITAADKPTLSSADKAEDYVLTDWTTEVAEGDTFRINVDSVATVTRVLLTLKLLA